MVMEAAGDVSMSTASPDAKEAAAVAPAGTGGAAHNGLVPPGGGAADATALEAPKQRKKPLSMGKSPVRRWRKRAIFYIAFCPRRSCQWQPPPQPACNKLVLADAADAGCLLEPGVNCSRPTGRAAELA